MAELKRHTFEIAHAPGADIDADILAALEAVRLDPAALGLSSEEVPDGAFAGLDEDLEDDLAQPASRGETTRCRSYSDKHYECCTYYNSGTVSCRDYYYECHYYGSGGYRHARGSVSSHCGWRGYDGYHQCEARMN